MAQLEIYGRKLAISCARARAKLTFSRAHKAGGAGNPSPAPAPPQEIKILSPEAIPPTYRTAPSTEASPLAREEQASPALSSQREAQSPLSLAEQVRRFSLSNRENAINDSQTDVFDFQGPGNREETLNVDELAHAAQVQVDGRSTAIDVHPSSEGAALNRFRQQDMELGRVRPGRQE